MRNGASLHGSDFKRQVGEMHWGVTVCAKAFLTEIDMRILYIVMIDFPIQCHVKPIPKGIPMSKAVSLNLGQN